VRIQLKQQYVSHIFVPCFVPNTLCIKTIVFALGGSNAHLLVFCLYRYVDKGFQTWVTPEVSNQWSLEYICIGGRRTRKSWESSHLVHGYLVMFWANFNFISKRWFLNKLFSNKFGRLTTIPTYLDYLNCQKEYCTLSDIRPLISLLF
jgi:hypothetical protein